MREQKNYFQQFDPQFSTSIIEEFITVGVDQTCKNMASSKQFKWITNLRLVDSHQRQQYIFESKQIEDCKYLQLSKNLYLAVYFCQQNLKPISRIKSSQRPPENSCILEYPTDSPHFDQYLFFETIQKFQQKRIIQDIEIIDIASDSDAQIPGLSEGQACEIVRVPLPVEKESEQSSSNEHLVHKTRYLIIRTVDLNDEDIDSQTYESKVVDFRKVAGSSLKIDYGTFHHFCFPTGLKIYKIFVGCGYDIFNFVLTEEDGTRVYVSCLKFKQLLHESIKGKFALNKIEKQMEADQYLLAQKAFCIASKSCYTDFFANLLEEIFRKYQSKKNEYIFDFHKMKDENHFTFSDIAIEFIEKYQTALQKLKKEEIEDCQYMKEDLIASLKVTLEWNDNQIIFPSPTTSSTLNSFHSPKAIYCLFKVLAVDKITMIMEALLLQKKIIFVSDSQIVLGYVIESFLSFLYPLKWEHVLLPILPQSLIDYLQAPLPLIAGLSSSMANQQDMKKLTDSLIVFLDCNEVIQTYHEQKLKLSHLKQAKKKLKQYEVYSKQHVIELLELKDKFYTFKIHENDESFTFSAEHIKHIFFQMMLLILHDYNKYYKIEIPEIQSHKNKSSHEFNYYKQYRYEDFIKSHSKNSQSFISKFCECTHFINFVNRGIMSPNNPEVIFVENALKIKNLDFSPNKNNRISQNLYDQRLKQALYLKKKMSLPTYKNTNDCLTPKKISHKEIEQSTNYTRNIQKPSLKIQEIDDPEIKMTKARNICEAISRAMQTASRTGSNMLVWTQAKASRLKKYFGGKTSVRDKKQIEDKGQVQN